MTSRPLPEAGPTQVSVVIWFIDLDSIDSSAQTFTANVYIGLRWKDPRLSHGGSGVQMKELSQIWHPRVIIANETGRVRRTRAEIAEIQPDGLVVYLQRYVGSFAQPLMLDDFPFDRHTFQFQLVAPGHHVDEIELVPYAPMVVGGMADAAGIAADRSLPDWVVEAWETKNAPYDSAPGVEMPGYVFEFQVSRRAAFFVWNVLLPLILIVMMSWSVFWIDPKNAGSQISVATTAMLTLIAYRFAVGSLVPRVHYMTRLDEFTLSSTVVVFLTLVHVIVTSRLAYCGKLLVAQRIDRVSRAVFPLSFIVMAIWTLAL